MPQPALPLLRRVAAGLLPLLLAACGGGGGGYENPPPSTCSIADQKLALADYMDRWYFWYALAPNPDPAAYATPDDYLAARLYTGSDPAFPADRWSFLENTSDFNRFFGDGQTLGYGVSVAGLEVAGQPDQPLLVRYVDPGSPAAAQGVARGDEVRSVDGRSAADLIAAGDYAALTPAQPGDTLSLVLRRGGVDRSVTLAASVYALAPVPTASVLTSPQGRRLGYVLVKDMVSPALAPLETAFAQFRAAGIDEVVLDLRYNGGGLVSVADQLASYVAGARGSGHTFVSLLYNDQQAASQNQSYVFADLASAAGVARVFVLAGPRTCSASETVINGLRGVGIDVVAIGDTSCGKPVGFLPQDDGCGTTYNIVNFEVANERNEGRYFDGFAATCPVAENFSRPLGAPSEPLLAAAATYADTGACPAGLATALRAPRARPKGMPLRDGGERPAMLAR